MRHNLFRACLALATGLSLMLAPAYGESTVWPDRSITLIVPFPPGGATDIVARIVANQLGPMLGQTIVVENKAGAAGAIGMGELARAKADGYTFAVVTDSIPLQPLLRKKLDWKMDQFSGVTKMATSPEVLVVNPTLKAQNVGDLVSLAKQNPGKLSYAASSAGSVHHLAGEMFNKMVGINMVHIPYKGGGQSITDMVSGRVDAGFIGVAPILELVRSGKLRVLAQTGDARNAVLPNVPTFREAGYGDFNVQLWIGMLALRDTPPEIVDRMQRKIADVLAKPEVRARLEQLGFNPVGDHPETFQPWLIEQQKGWSKIIAELGLASE